MLFEQDIVDEILQELNENYEQLDDLMDPSEPKRPDGYLSLKMIDINQASLFEKAHNLKAIADKILRMKEANPSTMG